MLGFGGPGGRSTVPPCHPQLHEGKTPRGTPPHCPPQLPKRLLKPCFQEQLQQTGDSRSVQQQAPARSARWTGQTQPQAGQPALMWRGRTRLLHAMATLQHRHNLQLRQQKRPLCRGLVHGERRAHGKPSLHRTHLPVGQASAPAESARVRTQLRYRAVLNRCLSQTLVPSPTPSPALQRKRLSATPDHAQPPTQTKGALPANPHASCRKKTQPKHPANFTTSF